MVEPINTENTANLRQDINHADETQQRIFQPIPPGSTGIKEKEKKWWHYLGFKSDSPKKFVQPWCGGKRSWYLAYRIAGWVYAGTSMIILLCTNAYGVKYFIFLNHWIYLIMFMSIIINAYPFVRYYFINGRGIDFNQLNANALVGLYGILDDIIGASPVYMVHAYQTSAFGNIYVVFTIIYFAYGGTNHLNQPFVYTVLDYSKPGRAAVWILILNFIALPSVHFGRWTLNWLARHRVGKPSNKP